MKVLVTGAGGFLGRAIVAALLRHGHSVRAMVRPAGSAESLPSDPRVEIFRADLRSATNLADAFTGCDAAVHAAAAMGLDDFSTFHITVTATERFLAAIAGSDCKRLLLVGSFSVYNFTAARGVIDESSPTVDTSVYTRGGYAMAKLWQERLCRRAAATHGLGLTIVRPGFIWGPGNDDIACIGQRLGTRHVVFGSRRLPLTYVENCADAIVTALQNPAAIGQVYNIIDDDACTSWRYAGLQVARDGRGRRIYLPYTAMKAAVGLVDAVSRFMFKGRGQLPSMFNPVRFDQRFKPFRYFNGKLRQELRWNPPVPFEEAAARTFGPAHGQEGCVRA